MTHRCSVALSAVLALALLAPVAASGQSAPAAGGEPFRTPWGDPDLQGTWTNTTTTPLQRPADLADREFLTTEEHAVRDQQVALSVDLDNRYPAGDGTPVSVGAYNNYWMERGTLGTRTSLIVDPPDGRLPPMTPEEEALQRRGKVSTFSSSRFDSVEDFNALDRCISRGMPGAMMPGFYNHNYQILQTPDHVVIFVEMVHDARIIPLDGRAHPAGRGAAMDGRLARALGGRDAGRRVDELQQQGQRAAGARAHAGRRHRLRRRREPAADRALHPRERRRHRLRVHGGRSVGVGGAVDRLAAHDGNRRSAVRVRLPRGQLRDDQHPGRALAPRSRRAASPGRRRPPSPCSA